MVPRFTPLISLAFAFTLPLAGCRPISSPLGLFTAAKLTPIMVAPDSVNLDIVFVERPLGDRLLGADLWKGVDQIAAIDEPTRNSLKQSGFRLGVTGSSPPQALQTLLGLSSDFVDEPSAEQEKRLAGHQAILRNGWSTEIQVGPTWDSCRVPLRRPGSETPVEKTFESVRCVYKVTARREQDGWVKLEFLPQIHYGTPGRIIKPGEGQFEMTYTQNVEDYPNLQFNVTLAVGEMAVITSNDLPDPTLARLFFVGPEDSPRTQRVLVLRLANMGRMDDPYRE